MKLSFTCYFKFFLKPTTVKIEVQVVPDMESQVHEVVVVGRAINLGTGNLEWGGMGRG
jgi:hypothetical protein